MFRVERVGCIAAIAWKPPSYSAVMISAKQKIETRIHSKLKEAQIQTSTPRLTIAQSLKSALLYFALVFGAGLLLGPIRLLWAVPHWGVRTAELLEMPLMLTVIILSARWVVRRFEVPPRALSALGIGLIGLGLMLGAEFTMVLWLRGLTIAEYLATRDPVSGTAYYIALGVFALLPWFVSRSRYLH